MSLAPDLLRKHQQADLGLFIDMVEGGELDMRVAARAALAFDALLRDIAESVDPGSSEALEINLIRGDEGSLNLRARLKGALTQQALIKIALVAVSFIAGKVADDVYQQVLESVLGRGAVAVAGPNQYRGNREGLRR